MSRITLDKIEELAQKFRIDNNLSESEPINIKTIIRKLNILTMYRPLSKDAFGLSLKTKDPAKHFMLINSNNSRGRQHFTVGHELFHLYFEEKSTPHFCKLSAPKDASEKNADSFSSCLLMPKTGILQLCTKEEIVNGVSMAKVLQMEQLFGVSHQAMSYRLRLLNLISEKQLKKLLDIQNIKYIASSYGYDLALYQPGNENLVLGDFGTKAKELFEEEKISEGHYYELLNMIRNGQNEKNSSGC